MGYLRLVNDRMKRLVRENRRQASVGVKLLTVHGWILWHSRVPKGESNGEYKASLNIGRSLLYPTTPQKGTVHGETDESWLNKFLDPCFWLKQTLPGQEHQETSYQVFQRLIRSKTLWERLFETWIETYWSLRLERYKFIDTLTAHERIQSVIF